MMYKMSEQQELEMDKKLMIYADYYAKQAEIIRHANPSGIGFFSGEDGGGLIFHYESIVYPYETVKQIAASITDQQVTDGHYESYNEHLVTLEQYITDNLTDGWICRYGENGDVELLKYQEETEDEPISSEV